MIDKKLIHFNQMDTFEAHRDEIPEHSIVFIKDSCTISTRSQDYKFVNWSVLLEDIPQGYDKFVTGEGLDYNALDGPFYVKLNKT